MTTRHVPALDGVRGVAILLVVVSHLMSAVPYVPALRGIAYLLAFGWIGVDVFFVLSGFLITGLLLDAPRTAPAAVSFYRRRAFRIWPLYLLALALLSVLAWGAPAIWPTDAPQFRAVAPWLWTHTVNVAAALRDLPLAAGWFGALGFWSLALEEQFYAVWPALALGRPAHRVARWAFGAWIVSLVTRGGLAAAGWSESALYVFPLARLDGLAAGAWLACAAREPTVWRRVRRATARLAERPVWVVLAWLTLFLLVRVVLPRVLSFPVGQVLVLPLIVGPVLATVAAAVAHPASPLARLLSVAWLRGAGRISYGLYVWHLILPSILVGLTMAAWPAQGGVHRVVHALSIPFAVLVAWASWRWWEAPWLRWRDRRRPGLRSARAARGTHAS